jgi:hypothetical protein
MPPSFYGVPTLHSAYYMDSSGLTPVLHVQQPNLFPSIHVPTPILAQQLKPGSLTATITNTNQRRQHRHGPQSRDGNHRDRKFVPSPKQSTEPRPSHEREPPRSPTIIKTTPSIPRTDRSAGLGLPVCVWHHGPTRATANSTQSLTRLTCHHRSWRRFTSSRAAAAPTVPRGEESGA